MTVAAAPGGAKDRVIIFTADAGFVMPTMAVVDQLLAQPVVAALADIIVYLVDVPADRQRALEDAFDAPGLSFARIPDELLTLPDDVRFNRTHVPRSTLARLSLGGLIPTQYEHVLYLDGDVQILGDVAPLVRHDVAPGKIAAINDAAWMYDGDSGGYWRGMRAYLDGLRVRDPKGYFNAGVLAFRRATWDAAAGETRDFFLRNSDLCLYHDQSALNATFYGRREVVSPLYNFVSGYADLGIADALGPRIVHFTGAAKPWICRCRPWHGRFLPYYDELLTRHPVLKSFYAPPSPAKITDIEGEVERRWRRMMLRAPWRLPIRRRRLRRYLADTAFAV